MGEPTFKPGDRVTKTKGSNWTGRVVGTYSTALTPEGYAVESETEKGSVQIYPAAALSPAPALPESGVDALTDQQLRWIADSKDTGTCRARIRDALATPAPAPAPAPATVDAAGLVARLVIPMVQERSREPGDAWDQAASALAAAAEREAELLRLATEHLQARHFAEAKAHNAHLAIIEERKLADAAAEREAALEEKVRQSALDYLALDMQATEALEREAALVRELKDAVDAATAMDECQKGMFVRMQAAEARVTAAEAERDAEKDRADSLSAQHATLAGRVSTLLGGTTMSDLMTTQFYVRSGPDGEFMPTDAPQTALRDAVIEEREACVLVAINADLPYEKGDREGWAHSMACRVIEARIRARAAIRQGATI